MKTAKEALDELEARIRHQASSATVGSMEWRAAIADIAHLTDVRNSLEDDSEDTKNELWEAYTAGAENGYAHADEGEALTFDALLEDFDYWLESRDA